MNIFASKPISDLFNSTLTSVSKSLALFSDDDILKKDSKTLAETIANSYKIPMIEVDYGSRQAKTEMRTINEFDVFSHNQRPKAVQRAFVKYTFKVEGNINLLFYRPLSRTFQGSLEFQVSGMTFSVGYQTHYVSEDLNDQVKAEVKRTMGALFEQFPTMQKALNEEVAEFNNSLASLIQVEIEKRKSELIKKRKQDNDLNDL